ncbi:MAG: hypothetical protein KGL39_39700 [Patescibacteria group bacterium]|nr:hypothetical protein [Patescibacteria group bacterium]
MASKNATSRAGQMGAFAQAMNHQVMSGWLNYVVFQDATASPNKSPLTLSSTPTLINIPGAAATITITSSAATVISDTSGGTNGTFTIPANTLITLPLVTPSGDPQDTTGQLWLSTATSATCQFFFGCV